jgi:hypothetical protein
MTPLLWQQHREQVPHAPPLSNNSSAKISRTITRCCQRVLSQRQAEEPDDDDDDDESDQERRSRTDLLHIHQQLPHSPDFSWKRLIVPLLPNKRVPFFSVILSRKPRARPGDRILSPPLWGGIKAYCRNQYVRIKPWKRVLASNGRFLARSGSGEHRLLFRNRKQDAQVV